MTKSQGAFYGIDRNRDTTRGATDSGGRGISSWPICPGVKGASGVVEHLVVLDPAIYESDSLDVVPLADNLIDSESFRIENLSDS